ncbi:MAG: DUF1905 domain-containing protein [Actinomycetota bacterium]
MTTLVPVKTSSGFAGCLTAQNPFDLVDMQDRGTGVQGDHGRYEWTFVVPLWQWRGGSWFFITAPQDVSDDIDAVVGSSTGGFGSIRVEVTVGRSVWRTSLFPSKEQAAYVLPIKKAVRLAENLAEGKPVSTKITLIERRQAPGGQPR